MQNYQNLKVDLSNCDGEPIHIIGRIQPHGFMLILDRHTLTVQQVSQNIGLFLETESEKLLNQTLGILVCEEEFQKLEQQLQQGQDNYPQLLKLQGKKFFGFLHESQNSLVLECEPFEELFGDEQIMEQAGLYNRFMRQLDKLDSLVAQSELAVKAVQQVTAYDRVMLYRFDEDWHGEVIAEVAKPDTHSYLHHHFPATDIPAQARVLLIEKPIRQIADVAAQAINIVPYLNPVTRQPSDILKSELRNPSEIHLQYLVNMGVLATLSVSIVVNGKLWGIIACQHDKPVFINQWKRQLCCNIAQAFANAVLVNQEKRDLSQLDIYRKKEAALVKQISDSGSISSGLFEFRDTLLDLTEASGAALLLNGQLHTIGQTPPEDELLKLIDWISENKKNVLFCTRELSEVYPGGKAISHQASGVLVLEISNFKKDYLLYFKPEIIEERTWAGDPKKPDQVKDVPIHPRKSFAKWVEVIKGKSLPWSLTEQDSTQILVKDLISIILKNQADEMQQLNSDLSRTTRRLKSKNRRLEDFAHIISHNLRSPLSNMQGLYNLYATEPGPETAAEVLEMMQKMIYNMRATIDNLNQILQSELEQQVILQEVNLPEMVESELQNLQSVLLDTEAQIQYENEVSVLAAPKVYIESILHNLISNALKYRSPDRQPVIKIKTWQEQELIHVAVKDNGLGLDLEKVGDKMFSLYATFHRNKDAKGFGLYLAKMQAEAMGGTITVSSTLGEGSTFTASFLASQNL